MLTLIGDKSCFAIEYEIQPSVTHIMGSIRLWFGGKYIGSIEDTNILTAILLQLENLTPEIYEGNAFLNKSASEVFDMVYSEDDDADMGRYCFTPGEAFDDFAIVVFYHDDSFHFIWRLNDNPYFNYHDYSEGIQYAVVSNDKYRRIVIEFGKAIAPTWKS